MENIYKAISKIFALPILLMLMAGSSKLLAQPMSGAYTIDKTQAASATNFTTVQSFFTALSANTVGGPVTCTILNGPYTEQVTANAISGVSATNTITVDGNNQILQFSATGSTTQHTFRFNGADRITLKNLYIKALGTTYSWGVHYTNNADYNTLENCTVEITNSTSTSIGNNAGIVIMNATSGYSTISSAAKYLTIKGCTIQGGGTNKGPMVGMQVNPQGQNVDGFVRIENNIIKDFYSYGIYLYYASGVTIKNNDISRPNRTNTTTTYGIDMYYYCYRDTIIGNKIHDLFTQMTTNTSTCYGIRCYYNYSSSSNSLVATNAIYNIQHSGYLYGMYLYYSYGIIYANNTVSDEYSSAISTYRYGAYIYSGTSVMTGSRFVNNTVTMVRPNSLYNYGYYFYANYDQVDNNNIYVTGSNAHAVYNGASGSLYTTLADWISAAATLAGGPYDVNAVSTHPAYVNLAAGNLASTKLQLDGMGAPVPGISTDLFGNSFDPNNMDIGAVAFDVNMNTTRVDLASNTSCQLFDENIKTWVKNNSAYPQSDFVMGYRINNGTEVTASYKGTVNPGDSAMFVFPNPYNYSSPGSYSFQTRIKGKAWVGPYAVNVKPSPLGAEVISGTTFQGTFASGNNVDPDIVANPDQVNFEIVPPPGYSNTDFGTKWTISSLTAKTVNGTNIPGADTATFIAMAGQNLRLRYKPSANFTDSMVVFTSVVYSLQHNCPAPPLSRTVFVAPRPKAGIDVTDVCEGETMQLLNASTISSGTLSYLWDLGNGTPLDDNGDQTVLYPTHGSYTVKLYVTSNYGYKDSITKVVNVHRSPEVDFAHGNQCVGTPVSFNNLSVVHSGSPQYSWDFGDNMGSSVNQNPNYSYSNTGLYMVKLTVKDAKGCERTLIKPVTYSAKPTASFTLPTLTCDQNSLSFTNTSVAAGNTGYSWDFGDGNTASDISPAHVYTTLGTYQVKVVARNEYNCADSMVKTVTLLESPKPDFTASSQCMGEPVDLTNTTVEPSGTAVSYSWDFGDGSVSSNKDETHTFANIAEFEIVLKAEANNGCKSEKRTVLTFAERPVAEFSMPEHACVNDVVEFKNGSVTLNSPLTYTWDLGNGSTAIIKDPSDSYSTPGVKTVKLTASTNQGCTASVSRNITVSAIPVSTFSVESAKTGDGRMVLIPDNPGSSAEYKWVYGDGATSSEKNTHSYKFPSFGLYKVQLQVSENGCTSSSSMEIIINSVSADEVEGNLISLYPNPNAGSFAIGFVGNVPANAAVKIISITGQVVKEFTPDMANGQIMVNLTDVASGLYTVQVSGDNFMAIRKVTVTR
ncbi:MAG TPA: PKD domain-containing protein [Bacteroidia bacterium]|nr:PKD domain-containing protein [Bacteroidia bacterium]